MPKLGDQWIGPYYVWLSKCEICGRVRNVGSHVKCSKILQVRAQGARK